jgi:tetratricopeptide (TPR) repeat protein
MAGQFERRKYYRVAVEYRERAIKIAENTLPNIHPDLICYHIALAKLLYELRHRELRQALEHATTALEIADRVLPSDHRQFLNIYATLGQIYELMKDSEVQNLPACTTGRSGKLFYFGGNFPSVGQFFYFNGRFCTSGKISNNLLIGTVNLMLLVVYNRPIFIFRVFGIKEKISPVFDVIDALGSIDLSNG